MYMFAYYLNSSNDMINTVISLHYIAIGKSCLQPLTFFMSPVACSYYAIVYVDVCVLTCIHVCISLPFVAYLLMLQ